MTTARHSACGRPECDWLDCAEHQWNGGRVCESGWFAMLLGNLRARMFVDHAVRRGVDRGRPLRARTPRRPVAERVAGRGVAGVAKRDEVHRAQVEAQERAAHDARLVVLGQRPPRGGLVGNRQQRRAGLTRAR